jgi:hemolysin activation/secretion protein
LGGTGFVRGYDWSERTGDQGAMGMAELRYAWNKPFRLIPRAQLYGFVDGGEVGNLGGGFGGGSLASAGAGVRADVTGRLGANLELAVPLSGPRYDTGNKSPKFRFGLVRSL